MGPALLSGSSSVEDGSDCSYVPTGRWTFHMVQRRSGHLR